MGDPGDRALVCQACGWEGTESEAPMRTKAPSPDGTFARVYICPECKPRGGYIEYKQF